MNNFQTILNKLKIILSQMHRTRVHDKDVAIALGITPSTFASMKRRNTLPYKAILDFCAIHHINANALLFHKPINNFITEPVTIRYYDNIGSSGGGGCGNVLDLDFQELTINDLLWLFLRRLNACSSSSS
jgi:repressor LexA